MLRFWGDWCPACRAMFDYERKLVERYKNQPFALIGILIKNSIATVTLIAVMQSLIIEKSGVSPGRTIPKIPHDRTLSPARRLNTFSVDFN